MDKVIQQISAEIADNWPAFTYILLTVAFSIRFFSDRRAETRILRKLGDELHATIHARFDRLEEMVRHSRSGVAESEEGDELTDRLVAMTRRR